MNELIRKTAKVPARQLHLMLAGLLLVAAAGLWLYAIKAPLASLRMIQAERARLQAGGTDPGQLSAQLARLDADVKGLSSQLGLGSARPQPAQLMVSLIGDISALASAHGVHLNGASPAPGQQTMAFDEIAFDADATGSYAALLDWIAAIERARPNLSIAHFGMGPAPAAGQVNMKIRIAAYRPQESAP